MITLHFHLLPQYKYELFHILFTRWSHLARSGLLAVSRKQNFTKSHIINPLLTKFVRSRWLDIGLVLFYEFMGPRLRLVHKHEKKNLSNRPQVSLVYLTNRFHVAVRLFSNRSQMTSKCGKNKKVAHEA